MEANKEYTEIELNRKLIAELNPFRYRGYYYDAETNLYYLNSRYYDPEICRFVNADDLSTLDVSKITFNGLNLYEYCLNNPIKNIDENGYIVGWLLAILIASLIGAAVGAISYTASAVINYSTTKEWNWSWGDFLGNTIGTMIAGPFSLIPGAGAYISAGISGFASSLLSDVFNNALYETDFNAKESLIDATFSAGISLIFSSIMNNIIKVDGINSGRGSWGSISKQIYTKLEHDLIHGISWRTFGKMLGSSLFDSLLDFIFEVKPNNHYQSLIV